MGCHAGTGRLVANFGPALGSAASTLPSRPWTQILRKKSDISATKRMQIYAGAGVRGISVCPTPLPFEPKGNVAMRDNASWAASSRPKISRMIRLYLYPMPITSDLLLISVGSCGPAVKNDQLLNSGDLLPKHATVRGLLDPSLGEQLQWTAAGIRLQWAKVWAKTCTGFLQIESESRGWFVNVVASPRFPPPPKKPILQRSQLQPPWLSTCFSTACTCRADWNPIGRSG